ncbi:phage Gp37/Gp68 family protein [Hymenobacter saemangeumensis]|uniref:Phage Gp37/Gp68 family protein n=1 Tax=Hymenobacter saemangeumensis TaxID=1084522 RepID=A0ABP8I2G7_9BACT
MAENSNIEWTDHTFNPWRGCTKVSAGCKNCYAETLSKRNPAVLGEWGPNGTRVVAAESYWKEPLKWNAKALASGTRARVFCASLADVFEDRPELHTPRLRLLRLIYDTPQLDWLLLTKRPENIVPAIEQAHHDGCAYFNSQAVSEGYFTFIEWLGAWLNGSPPTNVWLGTSVENQEQADLRIPLLLEAPATVRFLSMEPLLGPVDLGRVFMLCKHWNGQGGDPNVYGKYWWKRQALVWAGWENGINWVIVGGESGPKARPMHPDWARSLRDQCEAAGVAFHFKQWGEYQPLPIEDNPAFAGGRFFKHPNGNTCGISITEPGSSFTPGVRRLMQPGDTNGLGIMLSPDIFAARVGKHAAGRQLDGRTWDELPKRKEVPSE